MDRNNPRLAVSLQNWVTTYSQPPQHLFLKLHGGVNWWYEEGRLVYLPFGAQPDLKNRWDSYEEGTASGHPVLLEPSFYKYDDPVYNLLKPQWDRFVKEMLRADLIIILGYSLPEADYEARRALTIAFQGNTDAKFVVIDAEASICKRYERLFGTRRLFSIETPYQELGENIGDEILRAAGVH